MVLNFRGYEFGRVGICLEGYRNFAVFWEAFKLVLV